MDNKKERVLQLDGIRFIMCCIIVISHFGFLKDSKLIGKAYIEFFHNPTIAVDYFFMLSGFGIFLSQEKMEFEPLNGVLFAIKKIKKVYFPYAFSLILSVPSYFLLTRKLLPLDKSIVKIIAFFAFDLTLLQDLTGMTTFSRALNGACWFLSCLFICYIIVPCFLKYVNKIRKRERLFFCLVFALALIYILSVAALYIENMNLLGGRIDDLWYSNPIIRCWYVFIGMLLGWNYVYSKTEYGTRTELGITFFSVAFFLGRDALLKCFDPCLIRVMDVLMCSTFLLVFSKGNGCLVRALKNEWIVKLGYVSMYIYLFHYPIVMIVDEIFEEYRLICVFGEIGYVLEILIILILIVLFVTGYVQCEKKLRIYCIKHKGLNKI